MVYVLGNIPHAESSKLLSRLGKDPDLRVRVEVVKALEKLARPDCVEVLLTLLDDEDEKLRRRVISSLTTPHISRLLANLGIPTDFSNSRQGLS